MTNVTAIRSAPHYSRNKKVKAGIQPFYKGDKLLCHAASVTVKSTGEVIDLPTNNLYNVYCYLWDQYRGYQSIGADFFESQDNIAKKNKIDRQSVYKKIFPQLEALGLLKRIKKGRGFSYIVYDVADVADNLIFNFDTLEDGITPTYEPERVSGKTKKVKLNEGDIPPQFSDIPPAVESVDDSDGVCDIPREALQPDPANECSYGSNVVALKREPEIAPITVLQEYLKTNGIGLTPEGNNYVLQWLPDCSSNLDRRMFVSKQIDRLKQGVY